MNKLKIAFVSSGANQFIRPYLEFFQKKGHQVYLISYDSFDADRQSDYPIFDISLGANARKQGTKWRYLLAALKARSVLKQINPDILHGHYVTSSGVICLLSGFRPYIVSVRGSDLIGSMKSFVWRNVLKKVFHKSSLVHTVSQQLSDKAKELGVPDEKLLTLTQGVDTSVFDYKSPADTLEKPVKLLCTRTLGDVYDPGTIVKACSVLKNKGQEFILTFAAGGPSQKQLEHLAAEKGLANQVTFMGGYDNAALPGLLHNNDIYISASLWDGTSISLLEAMSCGLFPVVSRTKSNCSWIKENETGLMFECGKVEELAAKIMQAISDDNLFRTAIETNRLVIEEKADRQKNMRILENIYYKLSSTKELA